MQHIRSILVVIDPHRGSGLALQRAKLIAGVTRSSLRLLICEHKHDHSDLLEQLASSLTGEGYEVSTEQSWNQTPYQTMISAQQEDGCGLVIKEHFPDATLKKAILTPDDWKLMRFCPCPVLLVKTNTPWEGGLVMACIDAGNRDSKHRPLQDAVVNHAYDLAGLIHGSLHLFSSYPKTLLWTGGAMFGMRNDETVEAYRTHCADFQRKYDIPNEQIHIREGAAETLIPEAVMELKPVVTVIGTVARSGFSGAVIGNTAEVVLDALDCDVLVLKPDEVTEHLESLLEYE